MKECRKCGEEIPYAVYVDGKKKSLQNRKFCLKCSPYRKHNTSPYDPIDRVKKGPYKDWPDKTKNTNILSLYKRGLNRRDKILSMSGGKCINCGYDKCKRALTFHHKNREDKEFGLTLNNLWSKTWEKIEKEWSKCELLCMNCHAELEDKMARETSNIVDRVNEKYGTCF